MVLLVLLFLLTNIVTIPFINYLIPFFATGVLLMSFWYSTGLTRVFVAIMLIIGTAVLLFQGVQLDVWMDGVTRNLALICLITIVPILSIPIHLGSYDQKIAQFATRYNRKPQTLFLFISGAFMLLGPITNLGSIPIIHSMLEKLKLPASFLGRSYVRGFTSINTWAPYFMSVFLVVYSLNIPMSTFLPFGLILSILQIIIANLLFSLKEVHTIQIEPMESMRVENPIKLFELLAVILALTGIIFFFENRTDMNASALIIFVVVLFSIVWSLCLKKPGQFLKKANAFRKSILPSSSNEVSLLLTAGFFSVALSKTVLSTYINSLWSQLAEVSVLLLIFSTIFLVALLASIGIHQIVTISSIIASVSYQQLGIHDITMAMTLLSAWAAATTVSPITPLNIVVPNLLKVNVFTVIFRWNLLYAVIVMCVHTVAIYMIHLFVL